MSVAITPLIDPAAPIGAKFPLAPLFGTTVTAPNVSIKPIFDPTTNYGLAITPKFGESNVHEYVEVGTGGIVIGGTVDVQFPLNAVEVGSGGIEITGSADLILPLNASEVGSGGIQISGTADVAVDTIYDMGSGGFIISGTADIAFTFAEVGSGGIQISGSGTTSFNQLLNAVEVGSGGLLITGQAALTFTSPSQTPTTIEAQSQQINISNPFVELFVLDCSSIGGLVYRFTPATGTAGGLVWQGNTYTPLPIITEGWEYKSDGMQAKPTLSVANVTKTLLSAVIALGDLVGASLTRYRTFANFLDDGSSPDPAAFFPPDKFIVEQKVQHDNQVITWQLASVIDRAGIRLPRRQITKDGDSRYGSFPGVGSYRPTGY